MKGAKRKPHSTSLILLLITIFAFWWGISLLVHPVPLAMPATTGVMPAQTASVVMVHESISGQTYTYSGTYKPSSTCDSFGSGIRYSAADGGHVSVLLVTEQSGVPCAQAASLADSDEPFTVSIKLNPKSSPAFDGVLLNGAAIPSQLVTEN